MAILAETLKKESSINTISGSLQSTRSTLSTLEKSVSRISLIIATKTKVRTELVFKSRLIEDRRREASKRKQLEDQIEASKVSTDIRSGLNIASSTGKGPLGRILSFLGYMGAGWILENLPTWIAMGKEFIARMRKAGELIYSIPQTMWRILENFGSLLSSTKQNILSLDFTDSSGQVRDSFKELTDSMQILGDQIYGGFASLIQPSGEVEIPSTAEQQPDVGFDTPLDTSKGTPGQGGKLLPIHKQALDIISKPESGGDYNAMNNGKAGDRLGGAKKWLGKNLTDMTIGEIKYYQNTKKTLWAAGRYQIVPGSLPTAQKAAGLKDTDKFDQNNQDLLAIGLLKVQGPGAWSKYSRYTKQEIEIMYKAKDTPLGSPTQSQPPKPSVIPQTPKTPSPPKPQSGNKNGYLTSADLMKVKPLSYPADYQDWYGNTAMLNPNAGRAFLAAEKEYGKDIPINSAYRSYEHQRRVSGSVKASPGYSKHGLGLAIDLQPNTPYYNWMRENGPKYGWYYSNIPGDPYHFEYKGQIQSSPKATTKNIASQQKTPITPLVGERQQEKISPQELEVQNNLIKEIQYLSNDIPNQPQILSTGSSRTTEIANVITSERKGQEILFIDDRSNIMINNMNQGSSSSILSSKETGSTQNEIGTMLNRYIKQKMLLDLNYV